MGRSDKKKTFAVYPLAALSVLLCLLAAGAFFPTTKAGFYESTMYSNTVQAGGASAVLACTGMSDAAEYTLPAATVDASYKFTVTPTNCDFCLIAVENGSGVIYYKLEFEPADTVAISFTVILNPGAGDTKISIEAVGEKWSADKTVTAMPDGNQITVGTPKATSVQAPAPTGSEQQSENTAEQNPVPDSNEGGGE